jgi:chromate reductase
MPANVVRYKDENLGAERLLIVTTGHGRSIPAVLKKAIDWGARPNGKSVWPNKPAFITGASSGALDSALRSSICVGSC